MPNTTVPAAAEGLPKINRRKALTVTGSGIIAALTGLAASTMPTSASVAVSPALAALIEEHRANFTRANKLCDHVGRLCDAPDCPPLPVWVPTPVAARDLGFRKVHRSAHLREIAAKRIDEAKRSAAVQTIEEIAKMQRQLVAQLESYQAEGLATLAPQEAAYAYIDAAEDASTAAIGKAMDTFRELIAAPCSNLADIQAKTAALLDDAADWTEMDRDEARTVLRSFMLARA